jgi:hypothetical protein
VFLPTAQCAPDCTIALSLHAHFPPRSHTGLTMVDSRSPQSPKAPTSSKIVASSPPSTPREARYHRRHGSVAGTPAAAISSLDRSKPRKPTTFYNPLKSEDSMPSIFGADPEIQMEIDSHDDAMNIMSAVPRNLPQNNARSHRRAGGYISHFYTSYFSILFSLYELISPHCGFYSNTGHVASCMHARDISTSNYLHVKSCV